MKHLFIIVLFLVLGCNNLKKQSDKTSNTNNVKEAAKPQKTKPSTFYTTQDTLRIVTENGDTLKFSKSEFNQIVDDHPEFYEAFPAPPDYVYHCNGNNVEFGSEQGQDVYYILYAYFLKQKNGVEQYADLRRNLISIYSNINSLFGYLQYGGTYFGHQQSRLLGYAEYSVYLYPKSRLEFEKTYDIQKQKELYINSLRQLIEDESTIDFETLGEEKNKRKKMLNQIVDELDKAITDIFYLRRAQEFQFSNYQYY